MRNDTCKRTRRAVRGSRLFCALFLLLCLAVPARAADYVIGEGDVLRISVWGEKDLSPTVKVRPDGKIALPALGELRAAAMTPNELQADLTRRMRRIVKNPIVTVVVEEITNNKVYVFGGGVDSGVYSLTQHTTLLQLLCQLGQQEAGQKSQMPSARVRNADLRNAYVIRKGKVIRQDFYDLFMEGMVSNDIVMEPNDAVFIPAFGDRNVYVMGAVMAPKAIAYRDGLTVVEALLEAGGFTKFAKQNGTVIYRKNGDKELTIPVKVEDLIDDGDLRQNTRLYPGDYVIVNESLF
jgi:polysaccharide export outer membrane protein